MHMLISADGNPVRLRFSAAIPLMAQFVNVGFAQQEAQQFLREMTGADFGDNTTGWLDWYENHKR
jgi:hypothetical protein